MSKGLYLKGVIELLKLSESTINRLVEEGYLACNRQGKGKRVFSKEVVQEFKSSIHYRNLKKQPVLVYIRASNKGKERSIKRKIENYCKENNFKANVICQLDRGKNEIKNPINCKTNFSSAVDCIFEQDLAGLIFYGDSQDVQELKKIFQAREQAFIVDAKEIEAFNVSFAKAESDLAQAKINGLARG